MINQASSTFNHTSLTTDPTKCTRVLIGISHFSFKLTLYLLRIVARPILACNCPNRAPESRYFNVNNNKIIVKTNKQNNVNIFKAQRWG